MAKRKRRKLSKPTLASLLSEVLINLSSGWLGVLLISPSLFQETGLTEYLRLLTFNLPFAIFSFAIAYWLKTRWKLK